MASLAAIGIVSGDIAASCRFYRAVGVEAGEPTEDDDHFEATLPNGLRLMFDTEELIRKLDPEWERPSDGHAMALAFECASAGEVDETYANVVGAGFTGKTEPFDAFWGQRYATVVDPDGNAVDLFAPLQGAVIHVGTSGWSYPSWRGDFYPAGADPKTFLGFYAERFDTVELNTTGYRLPAEEQFQRWAAQTPEGFTFAVKMPLTRLDRVGTFVERVRALGDRLGPVRIVVEAPRDDGLLAFLHGSLPPELRVAYDFRHESWDGVDGVVRVNDFEAEPFRYIRLREPPYSDDDLRDLAPRLRPPAYVFFRHEDAATAPDYAARLLALIHAPSNE